MKDNKPMKKHNMTSIAALMLFVIFAVSVLSVLLTGASAYRRFTQRGQAVYESQTLSQFIEAKVRQAPSRDAVSAGKFGDSDVVTLSEDIDGDIYVTRVYCYDGWLMELFSMEEDEVMPEDGEKLLPAQNMTASMDDGLLKVCITDQQGAEETMLMAVGEREGGAE